MFKRQTLPVLAVSSFVAVGTTSSSGADVLLFTDFDNSGVTGGVMQDVVWTENGLSAPTSLGASAAVRNNTGGTANGDAGEGYFSPDQNINSSTEVAPAWTATWLITVGASDVSVTDIVLESAESNSGSTLGAGNGSSNINISIASFSQTQLRNNGSGASQVLTYTPGSPFVLAAGHDYNLTLKLWEGSSSGNFESLDSLTFNGTIVPEPGSLALLGIGGLFVGYRRRR